MRNLGQPRLLLAFVLVLVSANPSQAQTKMLPSATEEVTQLQRVLWGGIPVKQVELTGTATQYAGSDVEQGTLTLTASADGSSMIDLSLGNAERKVVATPLNSNRECNWSINGTSHQMGYMNCLKPLVWFLPGISLQPGRMPRSVGINDLGMLQVHGKALARIQAQVVMAGLGAPLLRESMKRSSMNLDIDPATMLPSRLRYILHPDDGSPTKIHIEIRYSDYRKAGRAEIPYRIRRYVNGSLQLDIQITSVNLS